MWTCVHALPLQQIVHDIKKSYTNPQVDVSKSINILIFFIPYDCRRKKCNLTLNLLKLWDWVSGPRNTILDIVSADSVRFPKFCCSFRLKRPHLLIRLVAMKIFTGNWSCKMKKIIRRMVRIIWSKKYEEWTFLKNTTQCQAFSSTDVQPMNHFRWMSFHKVRYVPEIFLNTIWENLEAKNQSIIQNTFVSL